MLDFYNNYQHVLVILIQYAHFIGVNVRTRWQGPRSLGVELRDALGIHLPDRHSSRFYSPHFAHWETPLETLTRSSVAQIPDEKWIEDAHHRDLRLQKVCSHAHPTKTDAGLT